MTTLVGNRGQLWTSTLSTHLLSPHLFTFPSAVAEERCKFGDKFGESLGGSQAPPSFWKSPDFPGSSPATSPEVFRRLPRKFSHCGILQQSRGSPEVSQTSPEVPGLPRRSALSLGSLTPSPDSQKLSLTNGHHKPQRIARFGALS